MPEMPAFAAKLIALLRSEVGDDVFSGLVAVARAHAGGVGKAERARERALEGTGEDEGEKEAPMQQSEPERKSPFLSIFAEPLTLSDDSKTIRVQIFPRVGTYRHPQYGDLQITAEFLDQIKRNFDSSVYNQSLPITIDAEHQSKLSGAMGYIKALDRKGDEGLWAEIELNDRGLSLVKDDAFRHYSPEYYDSWTDPATGQEYQNVMIGGALTARPFFKGMQPLYIANEHTYAFNELEPAPDEPPAAEAPPPVEESNTPAEPPADSEERVMSVDPKEFAEVQSKLAKLSEDLAAEQTARQAAEDAAKAANERSAKLERENSRRELTELVTNNRFGFKGEVPEVVDRLERIRTALSDADWQAFVDNQKAIHAALSESELLKQRSQEGTPRPEDSFDKAVKAKVEAGKNLAEATAEAIKEYPKLYAERIKAHNRRAANPE